MIRQVPTVAPTKTFPSACTVLVFQAGYTLIVRNVVEVHDDNSGLVSTSVTLTAAKQAQRDTENNTWQELGFFIIGACIVQAVQARLLAAAHLPAT